MQQTITLQTLVNAVGYTFIEYVCNLEHEELIAKVSETVELSPNKEQALQLLLICISRVYSTNSTLDDNRASIVSYLSDYSDRFTDTVTANDIRQLAGGGLITSRSRSDLTRSIVILARDAYPFYLIPASSRESNGDYNIPPTQLSFYTYVKTYIHSQNTDMPRLLSEDDELSLLFPAEVEGQSNTMALTVNSYNGTSGGVVQANLFADSLIKQAFYTCALRGSFSCQEFIDQTLRNLKQFKVLLGGGEVDAPLIACVGGLKLKEGQTISTDWGILRLATPLEKIWLKSPTHESHQEVDVIFETGFKLTATITSSLGSMPIPNDQTSSDREIEEKLAIVSALPQIALNKTIRMQLLASKVIPPFQSGEYMSWPILAHFPFQQELTDEEIRLIEEFASTVSSADYMRIIISFRRIASAVQRTDITDGFIDLIIIWENLFGTKGGEVCFRIATSISKLLHNDEAQRRIIFDRVTDLYNERSNIVHGSQHYTPRQVAGFWEDALKITIEVLQKIITDRPEMLSLKSSTRSKRLALQ